MGPLNLSFVIIKIKIMLFCRYDVFTKKFLLMHKRKRFLHLPKYRCLHELLCKGLKGSLLN